MCNKRNRRREREQMEEKVCDPVNQRIQTQNPGAEQRLWQENEVLGLER